MDYKCILNTLPIRHYIIDSKNQTIVQTNDPAIKNSETPTLEEVFIKEAGYKEITGRCLLQILSNPFPESEFVVQGKNGETNKFFKVTAKNLKENYIAAAFTDISNEIANVYERRNFNLIMEQAEKLAYLGAWELDLQTKSIKITKGFQKIYKINVENDTIPVKEIRKFALPEYYELIDKSLNNLILFNEPFNIQVKIKRNNDGQIRDIKASAKFDKEKNKVFGISKDITDKVRSRNTLLESYHDLSLAQHIANIGNWKYNPENNEIQWSEQVLNIFESKDAKTSQNLQDFFNNRQCQSEQLNRFRTDFYNSIKTGAPFSGQFHIILKNKKEKWIEIICKPDKVKTYKGFMLRGTVQDITQSKKMEIELANANNLLNTMIQNLPDAIYLKDNDYRKVITNEADIKNCGANSADEIIGKTDFDIFPRKFAKKFHKDDKRVIENGEKIVKREEKLPGNPPRWLLTTKIPLKNEKGEVEGLIGVGHDITLRKKIMDELKEAKQKAEESDKLKSLFLANMSHEIRTPLNAILGFSNIIVSDKISGEKLNYFGEIIEKSGRRLTAIIDDIIDISLIQSNQIKINYSLFNINSLFDELFQILKKEKEEKLNIIDFGVAYCNYTDCKFINSDKNRIFQILRNLLDNAFKFTESGHIRFGCSHGCSEDNVEIFVEDTGIGITKKEAKIIFNPFRQIDEGYSGPSKGNGLGLAIVSGIVERLEGKIWLKSIPGKGSTFFISIPRRLFENSSDQIFREEKQKTLPVQNDDINIKEAADKKRVVSFEDDPASIEYLKNVVSLIGYEMINFDFAPDGIDFLRKNHADLVLMDVRMPEMNGFEATKIIKAEFPDLPIIIQTAYAMKGDKEKAIQSGTDDYLSKPVPYDILKVKINYYINQKK